MADKKVSVKNRPTVHDLDVIIEPVITEKTMSLMQEQNKVTVRVSKKANRADVKKAFEKIFGVKVTGVNIVNVPAKETTRGGRYRGTISGFKKAVVTVQDEQAIDLFKE